MNASKPPSLAVIDRDLPGRESHPSRSFAVDAFYWIVAGIA
jgi:hypothetical protein